MPAVSIDEVYALEELFKGLSNKLHKVLLLIGVRDIMDADLSTQRIVPSLKCLQCSEGRSDVGGDLMMLIGKQFSLSGKQGPIVQAGACRMD